MTDNTACTAPSKPRHYILVVHGMGDQKVHTTIPPVVHRFAEVRHKYEPQASPLILSSTISSHSVRSDNELHGWTEFRGIPVDADDPTGDFDGTTATDTAGRNFRFVELYWQDILEKNHQQFASSTEQWAKALMNRLDDPEFTPEDWPPPWAKPMLKSIVNVAIPLKKMLGLKYSSIVRTVFDDFLGDVHLYGDYTRTRGEAVRHFHAVLDKIVFFDFLDWRIQELTACELGDKPLEFQPYQKPEFSIIAHSLGSIMSFDALVYAHAKEEVREASAENAKYPISFPFTGYIYPSAEEKDFVEKNNKRLERFRKKLEQYLKNSNSTKTAGAYWQDFLKGFSDDEQKKLFAYEDKDRLIINPEMQTSVPPLLWRSCIRNFITLGSPIDKYLTLWHQNYQHLGLKDMNVSHKPRAWEPSVIEHYESIGDDKKIKHYNFCDEQDPVGHHLDMVRQTEMYEHIFDDADPGCRDVVFRRYSVPGVAHNEYWKDSELFRGILQEIIDRPGTESSDYFKEKKFRVKKHALIEAFKWAYFRVPALAAVVTTAVILFVLFSESVVNRIIAGGVLIVLWYMPSFMTFYKKRATVENIEKSAFTVFLKKPFSPGILANLLRAAVEWRRILFAESAGKNTSTGSRAENCDERISFQLQNEKPKSREFYWRWGLRFFVSLLIFFIGLFFVVTDMVVWDISTFSGVPDMVVWNIYTFFDIPDIIVWNIYTFFDIPDIIVWNISAFFDDIRKIEILNKIVQGLTVFFGVYTLIMGYELWLFIQSKKRLQK